MIQGNSNDYLDLIAELCNELDLSTYLYDDGDNPGYKVLRAESWSELEELNAALKQKFEELGVDTSSIQGYRNLDSDGYVDFALGRDNSLTFADESFICGECYQCYDEGDYANYFIPPEGGEIFCENCVREDPNLQEAYIATLINIPNKANTLLDENTMISLGFTHLEDSYEHGMYGRLDDPQKILDKILADNPNAEVVFDIIQDHNPWATSFTVWVR